MANTPTRPPNRRSERRTPPRGPHVASKSQVERTREHLMIGAEALKNDLPEVAQTLQALSKPFGHRMLTLDRNTPRVPADATNVTIMVPERLRKAIQDAALDGAESDYAKVQELLSAVLSSGIPRVLSGETVVREIPREPRGAGVKKVNLNVPVDTDVLQQLRDALPGLGERLGFRGKASVGNVAFRLLLDEYGLDYEPAASGAEGLAQMQLHVPPRLAAAFRKQLATVDADMRRLIEEGYTKVLSGAWRPYEIPKAAQGSDYERDILPVRVDGALIDQVRAKCPELKQELGYRVTPPTIAIDYLISELGLEDLADAEYGVTGQ